MPRSADATFLTVPRSVVILLVLGNMTMFALCAAAGGTPFVAAKVLMAHGALVPAALSSEGWRVLTYGFLHADPGHLIANMASLVVGGAFLERRLGATGFTLVYLATMAGAAIVSLVLHPAPFVEVGASGAIFGIQGALFALLILGSNELSPGFFLTSFALNFAFSARDPQIDWAAHVGGFITGMACIALLDLLARTNAFWMRCKFPEFVKMNAMLLIALGAAALWIFPLRGLPGGENPRLHLAAGGLAALLLIKLLDYLLAARHGLVGAVLMLAVGNGLATYGFGTIMQVSLAGFIRRGAFSGQWTDAVELLLRNPITSNAVAAACAGVLTCLVFAHPLRRGFRDVGFVGATYVADRGRERGLVRPAKYTRA